MANANEIRMGLNESTGSYDSIIHPCLPTVLEDILAGMNATYSRMQMQVRQGLNADDAHNRVYLGTYFPRSVGEWCLLWAELFAHPPVRSRILPKSELTVVSFGSGTGGDVVGTLYAIKDEKLPTRRVRVYSFDGNADALQKQRNILESLQQAGEFPFELEFTCYPFIWGLDRDSFRRSCEELRGLLPAQADLVQASKWLVEFYNYQAIAHGSLEAATGIIRDFLSFVEDVVGASGMVAIADVTTADCGRWFPEVMNGEAVDYLVGGGRMRSISPIPCAFCQGNCPSAHGCYTRRPFRVSSRFCMEDNSQLCYRVFAPMEFSQEIISPYKNIPYRVNWGRSVDCRGGIRETILQGVNVPSGFSAYCRNPGA